eukprot:4290735-Amphidinium_carterae.1
MASSCCAVAAGSPTRNPCQRDQERAMCHSLSTNRKSAHTLMETMSRERAKIFLPNLYLSNRKVETV